MKRQDGLRVWGVVLFGFAVSCSPSDSDEAKGDCVDGECTCPPRWTACDGNCTDTLSDGDNCGACGRACSGTQVCANGECSQRCPMNLKKCGNSCVDVASNADHCGGCDQACATGQSCSAYSCVCAIGQQICSDKCVDTNTSSTNCGSCDKRCASGLCNNGVCVGEGTVGAGGAGSEDPDSGGFRVKLSLSPAIGTVGIVEWSIDAPIESATINFGREEGNYEHQAPVDLAEPGHRTLLLGMKAKTTYYAQIVAKADDATYTSDVYSLETGYLPNGMPELQISDVEPSALDGGFTINCTGVSGGTGMETAAESYAFIFDQDGDYVWAYKLTGTAVANCSRARMSYDGKYMWVGNFSNVSPDGVLTRVSMDGLTSDGYSFPGRHHDFAILPNDHILFQEQKNGGGYDTGGRFGFSEGPDLIRELDPETGLATTLYDESTDFSEQIEDGNGSHTNYVTYVPDLEAISISLRHSSTVALLSYPDMEVLGVFGGNYSEFPVEWDGQHGHVFTKDTLLVFNNNGSNNGSSVIEYKYDLDDRSAEKTFDYSSGVASLFFGDVQRLPNHNILVTYSAAGVFHEVDSSGELLREIVVGKLVGYSQRRTTLYGPPPPFSD